MIGSSGNISPNYYHTHEHEITKCLHETKGMKPESAGGMAAGRNTFSSLPMQKQDSFSLRELLVSGLQGLVSRAFGFWGKLGETKEQEKDVLGNNKEVRISADGGDGAHGTTALSAETGAANVLAAALIKPETRTEEIPEEEGRKVGNVEGAISGGLKREQGGIQKFLQKFSETAAKAGQFLKKRKQPKTILPESDMDFAGENNSFLLDSYNRMGEYSTLAQDRSLEGNFRAKG